MENNLSLKIKELRLRKNLSQKRFGNKIGVSAKAISAYEKGRCMPSMKILEEIHAVYNVNLTGSTPSLKEKLSQIESQLNELRNLLCIYE